MVHKIFPGKYFITVFYLFIIHYLEKSEPTNIKTIIKNIIKIYTPRFQIISREIIFY